MKACTIAAYRVNSDLAICSWVYTSDIQRRSTMVSWTSMWMPRWTNAWQ